MRRRANAASLSALSTCDGNIGSAPPSWIPTGPPCGCAYFSQGPAILLPQSCSAALAIKRYAAITGQRDVYVIAFVAIPGLWSAIGQIGRASGRERVCQYG